MNKYIQELFDNQRPFSTEKYNVEYEEIYNKMEKYELFPKCGAINILEKAIFYTVYPRINKKMYFCEFWVHPTGQENLYVICEHETECGVQGCGCFIGFDDDKDEAEWDTGIRTIECYVQAKCMEDAAVKYVEYEIAVSKGDIPDEIPILRY